jgi:hypothetical protein
MLFDLFSGVFDFLYPDVFLEEDFLVEVVNFL